MEEIGFSGIQEIRTTKDYADILFGTSKARFILEVKIEERTAYDSMMKGIVQAHRYSLDFHTPNYIVAVYPSWARQDLLAQSDELTERALKMNTEATILTENWEDFRRKITVEDLLTTLKAKIDQDILAAHRVEPAATIILRAVETLARILNKHYKDDSLLKEVTADLTEDYGLFLELSRQKVNSTKEKDQTVSLVAYILVNQILFYYLYAKQSQLMPTSMHVDEITRPIRSIADLETFFDQIRAVDYKPIFDIRVTQRIPHDVEILDVVNRLIEVLTPLRVDQLPHDLYGRLFTRSLPEETRAILASYYTKESSADLLASLTIDSHSDTVWDLACGSGTLLVSSYDRKMRLFRKEKQVHLEEELQNKLHLKFIEDDITGIDIMPFACHLTGLNLSAKNLRVHTDFLRIAQKNSVSIASMTLPCPIEEAYGNIGRDIEGLHPSQQLLDDESGSLTSASNPRTFVLKEVDRVVVNPPFTGINQLPQKYRESFTDSPLSDICGRRVNLWGYFLALANHVLRNGGKVGAIIPLSFLRGSDTLEIRKFYLEQYKIEYIVTPMQGKTFSQDSDFADMILIATKIRPDKDTLTRIVCLKTDIDGDSTVVIDELARSIRTQFETEIETDRYLTYSVSQAELLRNCDNLVQYVITNSSKTKKDFDDFIAKLKGNPKLRPIERKAIEDGYQIHKKGIANRSADLSLITMRSSDTRGKRSRYSFDREADKQDPLEYTDSETHKKKSVDKLKLVKTMRTINGVDELTLENIHDYLLRERAIQKTKSHVFIACRFRLNSEATKLAALYSDEAITPLNLFIMHKGSQSEAKILSLYFNSICYLVQLLKYANQSTGGWIHVKQVDLAQILIPDISKLDDGKRDELLRLFEQYRSQKFDSLVNQLTSKPDYRFNLDKSLSDALGLRMSRDMIYSIYSLILDQMKSLA
jgi:hypothetical protein